MNIIREGDKDLAALCDRKILRFLCGKCGCIWEADKTEYHLVTSSYNEEYAVCNCPTCDHKEYLTL